MTNWEKEICTEDEFPLATVHIHFYAPTEWTDDEENQRIHDALVAEVERFRAVARDLVNGIVPATRDLRPVTKNERVRIGVMAGPYIQRL